MISDIYEKLKLYDKKQEQIRQNENNKNKDLFFVHSRFWLNEGDIYTNQIKSSIRDIVFDYLEQDGSWNYYKLTDIKTQEYSWFITELCIHQKNNYLQIDHEFKARWVSFHPRKFIPTVNYMIRSGDLTHIDNFLYIPCEIMDEYNEDL